MVPDIVVIGIDGAGKTYTAHAIRLVCGWDRVFIVWVKRGHGILYALSEVFLRRCRRPIRVNPSGRRVPGAYTVCHARMKRILPLLDYFSSWIRLLLLYPVRAARRLVVAERFFADTLAYYLLLDKGFLRSPWARILLSQASRPLTIVVDADLDTVAERRPMLEYSLEEAAMLLAYYRVTARVLGALVIDTSRMDKKEVIRVLSENKSMLCRRIPRPRRRGAVGAVE